MNSKIINELQTFKDAVTNGKSYYVEVKLRGGDQSIRSTNLPISCLDDSISEIEAFEEGASMKVWDKNNNRLTVIPAQNISNVSIVIN